MPSRRLRKTLTPTCNHLSQRPSIFLYWPAAIAPACRLADTNAFGLWAVPSFMRTGIE